MAREKIIWDGEELSVTEKDDKRVVAPAGKFRDTVQLPKVAEIRLKPSIPGWGGLKGTTYFLEQYPPAIEDGPRNGPSYHNGAQESLFGRAVSIYPDGTFYPPELPQILDYVQRNWGWSVNPAIRRGLQKPKAQ